MKILKKAFSLAELLIALGIISIITVMGISIARMGTESAYNLFFYTGYKALYEAIYYANTAGHPLSGNFSGTAGRGFIDYITDVNILDTDVPDENYAADGSTCLVDGIFNGIMYDFTYLGAITIGTVNYDAYTIDMTVPTYKRKDNATNNQIIGTTTRLLYIPKYRQGILMPIDGAVSRTNNTNHTTTDTINLQERADLLPFYINRTIIGNTNVGNVGKINHYFTTNAEDSTPVQNLSGFTPRAFGTYRQIYCQLYNATLQPSINGQQISTPYCNCSGIIQAVGVTGTIGFENPRKAF